LEADLQLSLVGLFDHHRQHLCGWQFLAKPKQKGGWGIQNLFHFSQALATNSLWRALNLPGIWHSVIMDKYLYHHTVNNWLTSETVIPRTTSYFWRNITKSKFLITQWLS
jgi:hypothetical protein